MAKDKKTVKPKATKKETKAPKAPKAPKAAKAPKAPKAPKKKSAAAEHNLNKKELSEKLHDAINKDSFTKTLSTEVVSALFDHDKGIIASFLFGDPANKVTIPGFGTFSVRYRAQRKGTHPDPDKKPREITIPECVVVSFKAGKGLKERGEAKGNGKGKKQEFIDAAQKLAKKKSGKKSK